MDCEKCKQKLYDFLTTSFGLKKGKEKKKKNREKERGRRLTRESYETKNFYICI